ncbi:alpha/beta hydrolase [Pararhodobacter sp. CCB-MM2]|uniref:alpha/beta hydrolase n=1 Tax=Pararhodobacter sp. CCB-MM2 TaxID=1786003 RepID=UPI0008316239|nr:alpha/beta hydrolase [Pararhodobacter sp. CCB-MM2]
MARKTLLTSLLHTVSKDPSRDDVLAALWRANYPQAADPALDGELDSAIDSLREMGERFGSNIDLRRLLSQFQNPALLVRGDGTVYDLNARARAGLSIQIDEPLDHLGIQLAQGQSLSDLVRRSADSRGNAGVQLLRGYAGPSEREVTVALIETGESHGLALLFVIDPCLSDEVAVQIGRSNDLTEAETAILQAFLKGESLADIATARDRSLATVRTQFNTILAKFGVSTQAALVRVVLGLSSFLNEVETLRPVFEHPYRRKFLIPGPGGRAIEFYVAGAPEGRAVLHPSDVLSYTFSAEVEKLLHAADLRMISVARPGIGGTDPAPSGMRMEQCHAEDVAAVLHTLSIRDYVLFGSGLSSPISIYLGGHLPGNLRNVVLNTPILPRDFFRHDQGEAIPVLHALMRAAWNSPKLLRFLLKSCEAHIRLVGARRFIATQFAAIPMDKEAALRPENTRELQYAMDCQYTLGNRRDESDFLLMAFDWSPWIQACKSQITVLHGTGNPVMIPAIYDRFQAAYPGQVRLWPLQGAAAAPGLTHPEGIVACLAGCFDGAGLSIEA